MEIESHVREVPEAVEQLKTKRSRIMALLDLGWTPKQISHSLLIESNYIYQVRMQLKNKKEIEAIRAQREAQ